MLGRKIHLESAEALSSGITNERAFASREKLEINEKSVIVFNNLHKLNVEIS